MSKIKPYLLFLAVIVADLLIFFFNPALAADIVAGTSRHFLQMLAILPPIFLLIGLLDVWVPREKFMRFMGESSGVTGIALSILLGAAAAGPLYAAFPLAAIMIKKGVKFRNILIFLGAWSTMKIPMLLFEISSLGREFALTRYFLSLIGILLMAFLIDRFVQPAYDRRAAG
jgi:uncharacterized membrane protein YraQ (UPF0718 family)